MVGRPIRKHRLLVTMVLSGTLALMFLLSNPVLRLRVWWHCYRIAIASDVLEAEPHICFLAEDPNAVRKLQIAFNLVGRGCTELDVHLLTGHSPWAGCTGDASREKQWRWEASICRVLRRRPELVTRLIELNRRRMPGGPFGTSVGAFSMRSRQDGQSLDELVDWIRARVESTRQEHGPNAQGTPGSFEAVHRMQLLLGLTGHTVRVRYLCDENWIDMFETWCAWYSPRRAYLRFDSSTGSFVIDAAARVRDQALPEEARYIRPL